jgi:hypothetical protein
MRTKSGHLDVIPKQVGVLGDLVDFAREELLLIVEARAPSQVGADLQILTQTVAHHVRRMNTLRRVRVMRASCRVNVVIAGPPARRRGINPALDLEIQAPGFGRYLDCPLLRYRFRSAREPDIVTSLRQAEDFSIGPINLRMKREVRRQPFRLGGMDPVLFVTDLERGRGGTSLFVQDPQDDFAGGP